VLCSSELEILVTQLETIFLGIWPNTGCSSSTNKLNDENVYSVSSLFEYLATAKLLKDISAFGVPGPESATIVNHPREVLRVVPIFSERSGERCIALPGRGGPVPGSSRT
jgi:hypothetical protein